MVEEFGEDEDIHLVSGKNHTCILSDLLYYLLIGGGGGTNAI